MAAVDPATADLTGCADLILAVQDRLVVIGMESRERVPAEISKRTCISDALRHLAPAEASTRKAAGTALPCTDLPVPDAIPARV